MKIRCPQCKKINYYPRAKGFNGKCKCSCGQSFAAIEGLYYQSDSQLLLDIAYELARISKRLDKLEHV